MSNINNKHISCCFSGHRSMFFDMDESHMGFVMENVLKSAIEQAVECGYRIFYGGLAKGFDIIAAETIIRLKRKYAEWGIEISLISVAPFRGQEMKWSKKWRERHDNVLKASDSIIVLNEKYILGCYHERNRYMVDNCSRLIGLLADDEGGTKHTFEYAKMKGLYIDNIWEKVSALDPML